MLWPNYVLTFPGFLLKCKNKWKSKCRLTRCSNRQMKSRVINTNMNRRVFHECRAIKLATFHRYTLSKYFAFTLLVLSNFPLAWKRMNQWYLRGINIVVYSYLFITRAHNCKLCRSTKWLCLDYPIWFNWSEHIVDEKCLKCIKLIKINVIPFHNGNFQFRL